MATQFFHHLIGRTRSMLERWNGGTASILELTRSHAHLTVVVNKGASEGNLVISCLGPEYICAPIWWTSCNLQMTELPLASGDPGVALIDELNGVRIISASIEVKENVRI